MSCFEYHSRLWWIYLDEEWLQQLHLLPWTLLQNCVMVAPWMSRCGQPPSKRAESQRSQHRPLQSKSF